MGKSKRQRNVNFTSEYRKSNLVKVKEQ